MVKELVISNFYKVEFLGKYKKYGPYIVQINAISSKPSLSLYGDFNIREEFFKEDGINTYLTMVNDETVIYVCNVVKSYEPYELDINESIFIPQSIIDYDYSEEYRLTNNVDVSFTGINRYFDGPKEYLDFLEDAKNVLPNLIKNSNFFLNDDIKPTFSKTESLRSLSSIEESKKLKEEHEKHLLREKSREENEYKIKEIEAKRAMKELERTIDKNLTLNKVQDVSNYITFVELYKLVIAKCRSSNERTLVFNAFNDLIQKLNFFDEEIIELPYLEDMSDSWDDTFKRFMANLKNRL